MVVAVGGKKNTKQLDKVVISLLMVKKNTKQLNTVVPAVIRVSRYICSM